MRLPSCSSRKISAPVGLAVRQPENLGSRRPSRTAAEESRLPACSSREFSVPVGPDLQQPRKCGYRRAAAGKSRLPFTWPYGSRKISVPVDLAVRQPENLGSRHAAAENPRLPSTPACSSRENAAPVMQQPRKSRLPLAWPYGSRRISAPGMQQPRILGPRRPRPAAAEKMRLPACSCREFSATVGPVTSDLRWQSLARAVQLTSPKAAGVVVGERGEDDATCATLYPLCLCTR